MYKISKLDAFQTVVKYIDKDNYKVRKCSNENYKVAL